ncbi:hypothetical protein B0H19DRAFT_384317 [Mycena capillaripes]|nr:hypothetical protein B0H19DRAFT_384317 [Mycena capillaripes]
MDDELHFEPASTRETNLDEHGSSTEQYTNAFFSKSKHFVIAGGNFTNINQFAPSDPPDFRMIALGDLNLIHKIEPAGGSGVVRRRQGRATVRRMYGVRISGLHSSMTAALYQGDGAEEQWRNEISQYLGIRHPNLLQLYGIARTRGLYAVVFHDDLIPHTDVLKKYRTSHFSTVFLWACMTHEFREYLSSFSRRRLFWWMYTVWIRTSTGHLCVDLTPSPSQPAGFPLEGGFRSYGSSLVHPPGDSEIITAISLQDYHGICYWYLSRFRRFPISPNMPITLGSIRHLAGEECENSFEIAFLPNCEVDDEGWSTRDAIMADYWNLINANDEGTSIMADGWIRVNSANIVDEYMRRIYSNDVCRLAWLAQANQIFNTLDIRSNFDDYGEVLTSQTSRFR